MQVIKAGWELSARWPSCSHRLGDLSFTLAHIPGAARGEGQSNRYLGNHVFEGFHDLGTFSFLIVGETTRYDDHSG